MDVIVKPEEYCKRAVELGHTTVFTTNHGMTGNIFEWMECSKKYGLKMCYGTEAYYVNDNKEKDSSNKHIVLIAKNNSGVMQLNDIMSDAHENGFYYKPRIDKTAISSLNPDDFIITTACVAGIWDDTDLILALNNRFKGHFFLEVQDHNIPIQKKVNEELLKISKCAGIPIIHANDSHYIYPEDSKYRDIFLKGKERFYENEGEMILDYPSSDEIFKRYRKQGILTESEVEQALQNTLIFDECEEITLINDDIKLPSVSDNPSKDLKEIINSRWIEERKNIPKSERKKYLDAIRYEDDIIEKTHMENYFLIDYNVVKNGQEKYGGKLTNTGRGCFTSSALVHTDNGLKTIDAIEVGDSVVSSDGLFHKVKAVLTYDIEEPMVQIEHLYNADENHPSICTLDHKILVHRNGENNWIEAKNLCKTDYVCVPKIHTESEYNLSNLSSEDGAKEDCDFYYLPVKEVIFLEKQKCKVYDLTVDGVHNYLLNNMIVHNSAPSFYTTKILGLTDIDRIASPITLFPTRFMSVERILGARSLPDIDLNTADKEPFIKATEDLLGKENCAWMLAWKPLQASSAFRLYCKGIGKNISEYDNVAKNLDNYRDDKKWANIIKESERFIGVIESVSESPCSMLLYYKPVRKELGLVRTSKGKMCCLLDGYNCDKYKYLKNDYLTVTVWAIIKDVCELAGIKIPTIKELDNLLDDKTFDIYKNGLTCTINQADSDFATELVKTYQPKSVSEMSAFVAIIRPGCASLLQDFIHRKPYTTGVKELDDILVDGSHRMIYQELLMKYFIWLGIEETGSYDIIKKIAKKKFKAEELEELKEKLKSGWIQKVGKPDGFIETWTVVEQAARYSFNASHSLSYAYDSLYGAYLKSHYPLEYYAVALNYYEDDDTRTLKLINELPFFGISMKKIKFRYSRSKYALSREDNSIYKGISSIKYMNSIVADEMFELRNNKYGTFMDLLYDLKKKTSTDARQLKILIQLDFFSEFGDINYLLAQSKLFDALFDKSQIKKAKLSEFGLTEEQVRPFAGSETEKTFSKVNMRGLLLSASKTMKYNPVTLKERVAFQVEHLGYIDIVDSRYKGIGAVLSTDTKYAPKLKIYSLKNGTVVDCKIDKRTFNKDKLEPGDLVRIGGQTEKPKLKRMEDGTYEPIPGTKELWITKYHKIQNL